MFSGALTVAIQFPPSLPRSHAAVLPAHHNKANVLVCIVHIANKLKKHALLDPCGCLFTVGSVSEALRTSG